MIASTASELSSASNLCETARSNHAVQVTSTLASYSFEPLCTDEKQRWDELIGRFEGRTLFHRRAWLDYLAACYGLDIQFWTICDGSRVIGYFCGGILRKGPFRILGSPLRGWGTNFLGPVAHSDLDQKAFLRGLDDLAKREGLSMVELEHPFLSGELMRESGYEAVAQPTYVVTLTPGTSDAMWKRLQDRAAVRKAKRAGLIVEECDHPTFADEFYDEFVDVMSRKNLFPPYERRCPRLLIEYLRPANLLFTLCVREPGGNRIAMGLFPHDESAVYFWGGASSTDRRSSSPNDLLQWALMEKSAQSGITVYNMCGDGHFKSKFGGVLQTPQRFHKCYSHTSRWARRSYEFYFRQRLQLKGRWHNWVTARTQT